MYSIHLVVTLDEMHRINNNNNIQNIEDAEETARKTVVLSGYNYNRLKALGGMGETFNEVIGNLLDRVLRIEAALYRGVSG